MEMHVMTDTTPAPQETAPAAEAPQQQASTETDWQAKFEAQQKVNRDLEGKLNHLRTTQQNQTDALAKALGVKPEDTSDVARLAATVEQMQQQWASTQQDNLVLLVARENGITAQEDIDLLRSVTDERTMRGLASRIAKSDEPPASRAPRPDLSQGRTGSAQGDPAQDFANFLKQQLGR